MFAPRCLLIAALTGLSVGASYQRRQHSCSTDGTMLLQFARDVSKSNMSHAADAVSVPTMPKEFDELPAPDVPKAFDGTGDPTESEATDRVIDRSASGVADDARGASERKSVVYAPGSKVSKEFHELRAQMREAGDDTAFPSMPTAFDRTGDDFEPEAGDDSPVPSVASALDDIDDDYETQAWDGAFTLAEAREADDIDDDDEAEAGDDMPVPSVAQAVDGIDDYDEAEARDSTSIPAKARAMEDIDDEDEAEAADDMPVPSVAEAVDDIDDYDEAEAQDSTSIPAKAWAVDDIDDDDEAAAGSDTSIPGVASAVDNIDDDLDDAHDDDHDYENEAGDDMPVTSVASAVDDSDDDDEPEAGDNTSDPSSANAVDDITSKPRARKDITDRIEPEAIPRGDTPDPDVLKPETDIRGSNQPKAAGDNHDSSDAKSVDHSPRANGPEADEIPDSNRRVPVDDKAFPSAPETDDDMRHPDAREAADATANPDVSKHVGHVPDPSARDRVDGATSPDGFHYAEGPYDSKGPDADDQGQPAVPNLATAAAETAALENDLRNSSREPALHTPLAAEVAANTIRIKDGYPVGLNISVAASEAVRCDICGGGGALEPNKWAVKKDGLDFSCGGVSLWARQESEHDAKACARYQKQYGHCCKANVKPCVGGYRQHPKCADSFVYGGVTYQGCTHKDSFLGAWCAENGSWHLGLYHYCGHCLEDFPSPKWAPLAKMLRGFQALAFSAGDGKKRKFTFEHKGMTMSKQLPGASAGKWPAAVAIAGAVHDKYLSFDTRVNEVFSWWTKDASDKRSRVTLRHLLTFTSGFTPRFPSGYDVGDDCIQVIMGKIFSPETCAWRLYKGAYMIGEPGTVWDYNSYHLSIAMAMVLKATGMRAQAYLKKYLYHPAGMNNTYYLGGGNPLLAAGIVTTGADYDSFLQKYVGYKILPKSIIDVIEAEYVHSHHAFAIPETATFAMGHALYCENWNPEGRLYPNKHSWVGAFKLEAVVDRSTNTYALSVNGDFDLNSKYEDSPFWTYVLGYANEELERVFAKK